MIEVESNVEGMGSVVEDSKETETTEDMNEENEMNDTPPEDEKIEVDISRKVEEDLKDFFKFIKKNRFMNSDKKWTPARLEDASTEKLAPIIRKFRKQLNKGGAAEPDVIIQEIIDIALDHLKSEKSKWEFLDKITNPAKINPGSQIAKFNEFISRALASEKNK